MRKFCAPGTEAELAASRAPQKQFLFVYGTLRRKAGGRIHRLLARHGDLIGDATYQGRLYRIGYYPGVVPSNDPADVVRGEAYRLRNPNPVLRRLDQYEACGPAFRQPAEYVRLNQEIHLGSGQSLSAWVYVYNRPVSGLRSMPDGDFFRISDR